ncbi:integral membrane protein MviN [Scardovia wiggsiae F0424]|uniref:Integral membrane protein MviN n=1 Tax=Scardovia wiggsiae F0424 TaxID=857290 RepID=J0D4S2_9BIFI|nr:murein biosynthesis integral membrane protein MurJ [Scardovia wiggsiae]EJD64935.1 integral membrane protein MviN [Scardovia wiggsiae F0424]
MSSQASSVGRNSLIMASGTFVSRITGQLRTILLAAAVGTTGIAANAYQTGTMIPQVLFTILSGGVFNAVLVPQIVKSLKEKDANERLDKLITLSIILLFGVTAIMAAGTHLITSLYLNSNWNAQQHALVDAFTLWCMPQIFFYGLYTILGQILAAHERFAAYAWSSVGANIIACAGFGIFIAMFGNASRQPMGWWDQNKIFLTAGMWTLGVAFQAIVLFIPLFQTGYKYRPRMGIRGIGLRSMGNVAMWSLSIVVINQVVGILTTRVTNGAPIQGNDLYGIAGNASYQNAFTLYMLPYALVAVSIATAIFPRLSLYVTENRIDNVRDTLSYSLRRCGIIMLFITAMFVAIPVPIIKALLPSVPLSEINLIAPLLIALGINSWAASAFLFLQRTFYAFENGKYPFIFTVIQNAVQIIGIMIAQFSFAPRYWTLGVAISVTVSYAVSLPVLFYLSQKKLFNGTLNIARIVLSFGKTVIAAVITALLSYSLYAILIRIMHIQLSGVHGHMSWIQSLVICIIIGIIALALYTGILVLLRMNDLVDIGISAVKRLHLERFPLGAQLLAQLEKRQTKKRIIVSEYAADLNDGITAEPQALPQMDTFQSTDASYNLDPRPVRTVASRNAAFIGLDRKAGKDKSDAGRTGRPENAGLTSRAGTDIHTAGGSGNSAGTAAAGASDLPVSDIAPRAVPDEVRQGIAGTDGIGKTTVSSDTVSPAAARIPSAVRAAGQDASSPAAAASAASPLVPAGTGAETGRGNTASGILHQSGTAHRDSHTMNIHPGDTVLNRYELLELLNEGTGIAAFRAFDISSSQECQIFITTNKHLFDEIGNSASELTLAKFTFSEQILQSYRDTEAYIVAIPRDKGISLADYTRLDSTESTGQQPGRRNLPQPASSATQTAAAHGQAAHGPDARQHTVSVAGVRSIIGELVQIGQTFKDHGIAHHAITAQTIRLTGTQLMIADTAVSRMVSTYANESIQDTVTDPELATVRQIAAVLFQLITGREFDPSADTTSAALTLKPSSAQAASGSGNDPASGPTAKPAVSDTAAGASAKAGTPAASGKANPVPETAGIQYSSLLGQGEQIPPEFLLICERALGLRDAGSPDPSQSQGVSQETSGGTVPTPIFTLLELSVLLGSYTPWKGLSFSDAHGPFPDSRASISQISLQIAGINDKLTVPGYLFHSSAAPSARRSARVIHSSSWNRDQLFQKDNEVKLSPQGDDLFGAFDDSGRGADVSPLTGNSPKIVPAAYPEEANSSTHAINIGSLQDTYTNTSGPLSGTEGPGSTPANDNQYGTAASTSERLARLAAQQPQNPLSSGPRQAEAQAGSSHAQSDASHGYAAQLSHTRPSVSGLPGRSVGDRRLNESAANDPELERSYDRQQKRAAREQRDSVVRHRTVTVMIVGVILIVALVAASYTMGLFRFRSSISNGNSPWPSLQANESVNGDTSSSGPSAPSSSSSSGSGPSSSGDTSSSGGSSQSTSPAAPSSSSPSSQPANSGPAAQGVQSAAAFPQTKAAQGVPDPNMPSGTATIRLASTRFLNKPNGLKGYGMALTFRGTQTITKIRLSSRSSGGTGYVYADSDSSNPNNGYPVGQFSFSGSGDTVITLSRPVSTDRLVLWVPSESMPSNNRVYFNRISVS